MAEEDELYAQVGFVVLARLKTRGLVRPHIASLSLAPTPRPERS